MISLIILLVYLGSYYLYSTSKNAVIKENYIINIWIKTNKKTAKIIGITFLICSLFLCITIYTLTTGILFWLFLVATLMGFIVLFTPLNFRLKHAFILFLLLQTFELIF